MRHEPCKQGGPEWHALRLGIPTASNFDRLITPAKWEPTKGDTRRDYLVELLTERILNGQIPGHDFSSAAMDHGKEWEHIARAAYELQHDLDIEDCGICLSDDGRYGASPDGFVGEFGSVEFKNPESIKVHVEALLDYEDYSRKAQDDPLWTATAKPGSFSGFLRDHWVQTQGQMYVSGRQWTDLVSNFAGLPMVVVRVYPNVDFMERLAAALKLFTDDLYNYTDLATRLGWLKPREASQQTSDPFGISEADLASWMADKFPTEQRATQ